MVGRVPVFMSMVVLALAGSAEAQDTFIAGDGTSVEPFITEDLGSSSDALSVDLPLRLHLPSFTDLSDGSGFLDQTSMAEEIPGTLAIRYRGPQGVVARWVTGKLKSYWGRTIRRGTRTSLNRARARKKANELKRMALMDQERGRWWDRRWYHSLIPEVGGAPSERYVHSVGSKITIIKLGPLTISNEFRARLKKIRLAFSSDLDDDDLYPRDDAHEDGREDRIALDEDPAVAPPNSLDLWIGLESGSVGVWGISAKFKLRPAIRTRITSSRIEAEFRLRLVAEIAVGIDKQDAIDVELIARYNLLEEAEGGGVDAGVELEITFLRW